ncbi:MAG: flavodoxin family protein [Candidatus Limnocylindria bacterium]
MKVQVVYNSHKGNTRRVAERIGETLRNHGEVEVLDVAEAPNPPPEDVTLLVVGGPTEGHGMTPEIRDYLARMDLHWSMGRATAAFDTRVAWPRLLSGSAADQIANRLAALGAKVMGTPGSFLVTMTPELEPGQLERAAEWAEHLALTIKPIRV